MIGDGQKHGHLQLSIENDIEYNFTILSTLDASQSYTLVVNMKRKLILLLCILVQITTSAQTIKLYIDNLSESKVILYSLSGEKTSIVDTLFRTNNGYFFYKPKEVIHNGFFRVSFSNNRIDFIYEGKDIELKTDANNFLDSMKVISSKSNKLFYSFIKLNKQYKTKTEILQLILARYPNDDNYYNETKKRLNELQSEYLRFVNITTQEEPSSFVAKYIRSAQLPIIDSEILIEKQLDYLKSHALDNVNFNDASLINSDLFTNKTIEYLTYFRNPQLPKELLEKEFMKAVDTLHNKAKINQLVYKQITEYLIEGFKQFGFDAVIDYIVENYVIKDDLCLDVKTEGMIKIRIEQAKYFKIGSTVPEIVLPDTNGKETKLNEQNGEKFLIVYYASWCPHCKELLPRLNALKEQNGDKVEILAISLDSKKEDWKSFVKANCQSLVNISDLQGWDGKAANDYFIYATPTMFLVDKNRKIIGKPMTFNEVEKMVL